jgi:hypothetical protein
MRRRDILGPEPILEMRFIPGELDIYLKVHFALLLFI